MRFLARRFAAEGRAYFLGETNRAVSFFRHSPRIHADKAYCVVAKAASVEGEPSRDVLPDGSSTAEFNPLRADVSLPPCHLSFQKIGAFRGEECSDSDMSVNEPRQDLHDEPVYPVAVAEGLAYVWKAFGIATVIVFGGASLIFGLVATKLEIHSRDDICVKGRGLIQRKLQTVREQLVPLNKQMENLSQRWRGVDINEHNVAVKEVSQAIGPKAS